MLAGPSTINAVVRPITAGRPAHIAGVDGKSYIPSHVAIAVVLTPDPVNADMDAVTRIEYI